MHVETSYYALNGIWANFYETPPRLGSFSRLSRVVDFLDLLTCYGGFYVVCEERVSKSRSYVK
jgi:hypothetical protein